MQAYAGLAWAIRSETKWWPIRGIEDQGEAQEPPSFGTVRGWMRPMSQLARAAHLHGTKKMGSGKHQKSSKLETFKVLQIAFECSKRLTGWALRFDGFESLIHRWFWAFYVLPLRCSSSAVTTRNHQGMAGMVHIFHRCWFEPGICRGTFFGGYCR